MTYQVDLAARVLADGIMVDEILVVILGFSLFCLCSDWSWGEST